MSGDPYETTRYTNSSTAGRRSEELDNFVFDRINGRKQFIVSSYPDVPAPRRQCLLRLPSYQLELKPQRDWCWCQSFLSGCSVRTGAEG
jgi:hypothetical protein